MYVHPELTLMIKTTFRVPTDAWVSSLVHRAFMKENTHLVEAFVPCRHRSKLISGNLNKACKI
jgi:hypothetical protein